jgi:hypothetical protein
MIDAAGERSGQAIGGFSEGFGNIVAVGQRLWQIRKINDEASGFVGFQPCWEGVTVGNHRLLFYRKSRSLRPSCRKHGVEQAGRDLGTAVLGLANK